MITTSIYLLGFSLLLYVTSIIFYLRKKDVFQLFNCTLFFFFIICLFLPKILSFPLIWDTTFLVIAAAILGIQMIAFFYKIKIKFSNKSYQSDTEQSCDLSKEFKSK
jgi:hypothetical protein